MAQDVAFKYKASVYQQKINSLNSLYGKLGNSLGNLQNYQNQMAEFWDGDQASREFYNLIGDKIQEVKTAMKDCQSTCTQYQKVVEASTRTSEAVGQVVQDLKDAQKQATDTAGTAASIASLVL